MKIQKNDSIEAYKIVENTILNNGISGYTIYQGKGLYKHIDNTITIENTLIIELMFTEIEKVKNIVDLLKVVLNQESIILQTQDLNIEFI